MNVIDYCDSNEDFHVIRKARAAHNRDLNTRSL